MKFLKSAFIRLLLAASLALITAIAFAWPPERESSTSAQPYIVVVEKGSPAHPRNSEGGIVALHEGSWFQIWSEWFNSPKMGDDLGPSHLVAAVSQDEGRTWRDKHVLVENNPGDLNVMPASILRLDDGSIMLQYRRLHSRSSTSGFVQISTTEGTSWSPPTRIWGPKDPYTGPANSTLMQMGSGRLILPVLLIHGELWAKGEHILATTYWSDDRGRTWQRSNSMVDLPLRGAMEPTVAEKPDGGLLMVLRTELGSIFYSESTDGIQWSLPQTLGIRAPESRASVARIPNSKDMVLVWNNGLYDPASRNGHFGLRTPLTVAISRDGGRTWVNRKNVEADPNYEYTNIGIAFPSPAKMVLSYMASHTEANGNFGRTALDLRNAVIPISWLFEP